MSRRRNQSVVIENGGALCGLDCADCTKSCNKSVDPRMSGLKAAFDQASSDLTTSVNPALKSVGTLAIIGAALYLLAQLPKTDEFEPFDEDDDADEN